MCETFVKLRFNIKSAAELVFTLHRVETKLKVYKLGRSLPKKLSFSPAELGSSA